MITDEAKEKLKKQPKWVQNLVRMLDDEVERSKKQLESVQGMPKMEAYGKHCYLDDNLSELVIPFDPHTSICLQVGPHRYQRVTLKVMEPEHGKPARITVYGESKIAVAPNGANSIVIEPRD
mgnify:CR=1 FL=1